MLDILTGLTFCSISCFCLTFEHLKQIGDLDNLDILITIDPNASTQELIEDILEKAVDVYAKICTAQIWIKPTHGGRTALNSLVP